MSPAYFFKEKNSGWNHIRNGLTSYRPTVLFLDYDGTIVPIRQKPSLAVLPSETRDLLRSLTKHPTIFPGLVTGRSLADIIRMVRLNNIFYIANHGFQIVFSQKNWIHPDAKRLMPVLAEITPALTYALNSVRGVMIENKLLTLSVHYRNLLGTSVTRVKKIVERVVSPYHGLCRLTRGKKVIEIRPDVPWDKGHAVLKLMKMFNFREKPLIVYLGDDRTDEDAFKRLRSKAVTIRVGKSHTSRAEYYVNSYSEVRSLLKSIDSFSQRLCSL